MANVIAWTDRQRLMDMYNNCKNSLAGFTMISTAIQTLKGEIVADPIRTAEFEKLMLEDPTLTTAQVLAVIAQIKVMADYIAAHPI